MGKMKNSGKQTVSDRTNEGGNTTKPDEKRNQEFTTNDPEIREILLALREAVDSSIVDQLQGVFQFQFRDSKSPVFLTHLCSILP